MNLTRFPFVCVKAFTLNSLLDAGVFIVLLCQRPIPRRHLFAQSQQWKHHKTMNKICSKLTIKTLKRRQ